MTIFSRCDSIIKLSKANALLAQLDRASGYGPEGQGFESLTACQAKDSTKFPCGVFSFLSFINEFLFTVLSVDTIRLYKRYLHTPAVKGGIGRLVINLSLGSERTKVISISFSKMPVGRLKTSQTKIA